MKDNDPYEAPQASLANIQVVTKDIKRGVWLTGFLILSLIWSVFKGYHYITISVDKFILLPTFPFISPVYYGFILITLKFLSIIAVWYWSRLGVIAYLISTVIQMLLILAYAMHQSNYLLYHTKFISGISGSIILIACVWSKWKFMSLGLSRTPKVPDEEYAL